MSEQLIITLFGRLRKGDLTNGAGSSSGGQINFSSSWAEAHEETAGWGG